MTLEEKVDAILKAVIELAHMVASNPSYHSYHEIPDKAAKIIKDLNELKV